MSKKRHDPQRKKKRSLQNPVVTSNKQLDAYHNLMRQRQQREAQQLAEAKTSGWIPEISSTLLEQLQFVGDRFDSRIYRLLDERAQYERLALIAPARNLTTEKGMLPFRRPLPPTFSKQMVIAHIRAIDRALEKIVEKRNHAAEARPIPMPRIRGEGNLPIESGVTGNTWVSRPAAQTRAIHAERWQAPPTPTNPSRSY